MWCVFIRISAMVLVSYLLVVMEILYDINLKKGSTSRNIERKKFHGVSNRLIIADKTDVPMDSHWRIEIFDWGKSNA